MMLACRRLRVVPVTIHLALRQAIETLSTAAIVHAGRVTHAALLRDFGVAAPVIAVAGLNPHAGEGGALGREDIEIVAPAVAELRRRRASTRAGRSPADTMFHAAARRGYDAALCMYHDQALIPIKTLDFDGGGQRDAWACRLSAPRPITAPRSISPAAASARPDSLIAALRLAAEMAARRRRRGCRAGGAIADPDGLPPLREVIARHGIAARKSLGQNFILDLNLTRRIARAAGRLDHATVIEIGPGPGGLTRALLAGGGAPGHRDRARSALSRRARRVGGALSRPARARRGRCAGARSGRAVGGAAQDRRQPAVQYRHGAAAALARPYRRLREPDADVPARGRRAARRGAAQPGLWTAVGAGAMADRAEDPVRPAAARLCAAAQGDIERRHADARAPRRWPRPRSRPSNASPPPPSASAARCCAPASSRSAFRSNELLAAAGIAPTARAEELSVAEFCALARVLDASTRLPASPSPQSIDEFGEAELARAAAALGGNDRGDLGDAFVDIAVDDHVIVFGPVAHFLGGLRHSRGDGVGAVLRAALKTLAQCRDARRQHEYLDQILRHRLAQLLRPLPVDIGHDIAAGGERRLDRNLRRTIGVAENGRVFEQLSGRDHPRKLRLIDKDVIAPVDLARPRRGAS